MTLTLTKNKDPQLSEGLHMNEIPQGYPFEILCLQANYYIHAHPQKHTTTPSHRFLCLLQGIIKEWKWNKVCQIADNKYSSNLLSTYLPPRRSINISTTYLQFSGLYTELYNQSLLLPWAGYTKAVTGFLWWGGRGAVETFYLLFVGIIQGNNNQRSKLFGVFRIQVPT